MSGERTLVESKYQIETSRHECSGCAGEIAHGAAYHSAVVYQEEAFRRLDFCEHCWRAPGQGGPDLDGFPAAEVGEERAPEADGSADPITAVYYAFWKTRRPEAHSRDSARLRFDSGLVLEFFRKLAEEEPTPEDPPQTAGGASGVSQKRNLRFVLALLLLRKKRLVFESSATDGKTEWLKLTEKRDRRRVWWVENPELDDAELEEVREDIGELLHMSV